MAPNRSNALPALALALLAACSTGTPTTPHPTKSAPLKVAASTDPVIVPASPPASTLTPAPKPPITAPLIGKVKLPEGLASRGTVTLADAGLVSNNGSNLIGKVKAPASLISNNGGSVISDQGSGVISNHGAGYHVLAALAQQPVPNAPIYVLDAAGHVVLDAAGSPLTATTDAQGNYQLGALKATHNLVVVADLGLKGLEQALIVPAGVAAAASPSADLDLISTLTTGYILDQYVATQTDPVKTLDRLPAGVEVDTRAKAEAAFVAGSVATPDVLTGANVDATVTSLRKQDGTFDAQMDLVRRLLIVAGQADLGNGRKALDVSLGLVEGVAATTDGKVFVNADTRVWRIDPDGTIHTAFGSGGVGDTRAVDGLVAAKAPKDSFGRIAVDGKNRLLVLETGDITKPCQLLRVEADGTVKRRFTGTGLGWAIVPNGDDEVWVFEGAYYDNPKWWVVPADGPPVLRKTMTQQEMFVVDGTFSAGRMPTGDVLVATYPVFLGLPPGLVLPGFPAPVNTPPPPPPHGIYKFDPDAGTFTLQADLVPTGAISFYVDGHANTFTTLDASSPLLVRTPAGQSSQVQAVDQGCLDDVLRYETRQADGTVYQMLANRSQVAHISGGTSTVIAGLAPGQNSAPKLPMNARDLAFVSPSGLAVGDRASFYVADRDRAQIYVIDETDTVNLVAGSGAAPVDKAPDPTGPAAQVALKYPGDLARDDKGKLYFVDGIGGAGMAIRRLTPAAAGWTIDTVLKMPDAEQIVRLVARPDGTLYFTTYGAATPNLYRVAPGAATPTLVTALPTISYGLAVAPDGTIYTDQSPASGVQITGGTIGILPPGGALKLVTNPQLSLFGKWLACDTRGRLYIASQNENLIQRFDPATQVFTAIAGKNSPHFAGDGVDDGILFPTHPTFDALGDLFFIDGDHAQVKRIAAADL